MPGSRKIWCIAEGVDGIPFPITLSSSITFIGNLKEKIAIALQKADAMHLFLWKVCIASLVIRSGHYGWVTPH
jgi:hypothetical protein